MALPERYIFSVDQISTRWNVDADYVRDLILTRQLPQAYMLFGPTRLLMPDDSGALRPHPDCVAGTFHAGVLVSTLHHMPDPWSWPLAQVLRVFEFSSINGSGRLSLKQFRDHDRAGQLGWILAFEESRTTVVGAASTLVSFEDLLGYEALHGIQHRPKAEKAVPRHSRDIRKHRCRVVAEILWRRDANATLIDVYRHEWIQKVACAGRSPAEKTFREWVKDLNPNRHPGRRPR